MLENVKLIHACKLKCTYINRVLRNPTTMINVLPASSIILCMSVCYQNQTGVDSVKPKECFKYLFVYLECWHFNNGASGKIDEVLNEDGRLRHVLLHAVQLNFFLMDKKGDHFETCYCCYFQVKLTMKNQFNQILPSLLPI